MAQEIAVKYISGLTLWVTIQHPDGRIWNGTALVALNTTTIDACAVALTPLSSDATLYVANFPTAIDTAAAYVVTLYEQAGGSPNVDDMWLDAGTLNWDGSQEVSPVQDATDPAKCNCWTIARDAANSPVVGAKFSFDFVKSSPEDLDDHSGVPLQVVSESDGKVQISLPRGATYNYAWGRGPVKKFTVPNAGTFRLPQTTDGK